MGKRLFTLGFVGLAALACEADTISFNTNDSRYPFCREEFCDTSFDVKFSPEDTFQEFNGSQYLLRLKGIIEHEGNYAVALEVNGQPIGYKRESRLPGNPLVLGKGDCFGGKNVLLLTDAYISEEEPEKTEVSICFIDPSFR
ncbi:MAG TPA: hypothetical protein VJI68_01385 [Candidatus Nanoarchaeia archaeon]|nr:hypothetical protein [Candidatus Nanoarchaeia archaeon]